VSTVSSTSVQAEEGTMNRSNKPGRLVALAPDAAAGDHAARTAPHTPARGLVRPNALACRHITALLGAYVLGGLRGQQETRVRTHLARCDLCRAEYQELAEVTVFLDMLTTEEAAGTEEPTGLASLPGAEPGPGRETAAPPVVPAQPDTGVNVTEMTDASRPPDPGKMATSARRLPLERTRRR
jgi:Putative zinc-finger